MGADEITARHPRPFFREGEAVARIGIFDGWAPSGEARIRYPASQSIGFAHPSEVAPAAAAGGGCDPTPTADATAPTAGEVLAHARAGGDVEWWDVTYMRWVVFSERHVTALMDGRCDPSTPQPGLRLVPAPSPSPEGPAGEET